MTTLFSIYLAALLSMIFASNPVELGDVAWERDLQAAQQLSLESDRPILILFQEVPGCATCRNFGADVLTHPLIVEAIESLFVPLAIYNNRGGTDASALASFGEPSWNNPVVRIVDADLETIGDRLAGNYSQHGLTSAMISALIQEDLPVPGYLTLLNAELASSRALETATYAMHCFWEGEKKLGELDGVFRSTPGFQNGREVVRVKFDIGILSQEQIDQQARQWGFQKSAGVQLRPDNTPKYYLSNSAYRCVPMTLAQQLRVNSALGHGLDPDGFLSTRQLQFKSQTVKEPRCNYAGMPLKKAWALASKAN